VTTSGTLSHIDISAGYAEKSIPFYHALLTGLGYTRVQIDHPGFGGPIPERACWSLKYGNGERFDIEARPAHDKNRDRKYNRYEPGPHHLAFHADSLAVVDRIHLKCSKLARKCWTRLMTILGRRAIPGYYAVFFADPDGVKLEVVYAPNRSYEHS